MHSDYCRHVGDELVDYLRRLHPANADAYSEALQPGKYVQYLSRAVTLEFGRVVL